MCIARGLVGGTLEVVVAQSSSAAFGNNHLLAFFCHFAEYLARFSIFADTSQRHLENLVLAGAAGAKVFAAVLSVFGEDMLGVFQVEEGPPLRGSAKDNVAAASAVTTVGTGFGVVFHPQQVRTSRAALAASDKYLDVVYKVRGHCLFFFKMQRYES